MAQNGGLASHDTQFNFATDEFASLNNYKSKQELDSYAKAGDIAEEVLAAIRTVTAFGGQPEEISRYSSNLVDAKNVGIKKQTSIGLSTGFLYLVMFAAYGFGLVLYTINLKIEQQVLL